MKRARLKDGRVLYLGWQALLRKLGTEGALRFAVLIDRRADLLEARIRQILLAGERVGRARSEDRSSLADQRTA